MRLESPDTTVKDVIQLIRQGSLPRELIDSLANSPRWSGEYSVQTALVESPKTPAHVSMRFLQHLRRHDLAKVARDVNLPIVLRQKAETLLSVRLGSLPLGDRVMLAKTGSNAVACALLNDPEPKVIEAVLQNSRLREGDLYPWLNRPRVPADLLEVVAGNARWSRRYPIRLCLLRHPNTPVPLAYELLETMLAQDLRELNQSENLPGMVRERALVLLDRRVLGLDAEDRRLVATSGSGANLDALARGGSLRELRWLLANQRLEYEQFQMILARSDVSELESELRKHRFWKRQARFPANPLNSSETEKPPL